MGKTEFLADTLRERLKNGFYKAGQRFPSEYELALEFHVNNKTANKAVTLLTAERLLRRGKRGEGTFVEENHSYPEMLVGFLGNLSHPFYRSVFAGFQAAALEARALTCVVSPPPNELNKVIADLNLSNIAGFICNGYGAITTLKQPVIYIEDSLGDLHLPDFVTSHSYHGSVMMAKALLQQGHREIVIFSSAESNRNREKGFTDIFREAGIKDVEKRCFHISGLDPAYHCGRLLKQAFKRYPKLTAIVTVSDDIANIIIRNLEEMNTPWKGKITICGFGNVKGISDRYPIATIDQHPAIIGAEAFHALVRKIRTGEEKKIMIEPELINKQFIFPAR